MPKPLGLLVMHYGTPATMADVEPYYTHIRHGRPPSPEQLQDLIDRYQMIGGPSPLAETSRKQGELIQQALRDQGIETKLYMGAKHAAPFVSDAVRQIIEDGTDEALAVVLAPHYSSGSIAEYKKYAAQAAAQAGSSINIHFLDRWGTLPELIDALGDRVETQLEGWDPNETGVIFTAHSLPERILAAGDPYKDELLETARLVAEKLKLPNWTFAFQSASQTGEPWLGPDILDVLNQIHYGGEIEKVVACTVGFVSDHLEVRFDLGIEARERCKELGLEYRLADCINADEAVFSGLARELMALLDRTPA